MEIKEARVVVTGAAGVLGTSVALYLADKGARVIATDVSMPALAPLGEEAARRGLTMACHPLDVTQEKQVKGLAEICQNELGGVDVFINNAGIAEDGMLVKLTSYGVKKFELDRWKKVLDVNLTGAFLCGREAAALMVEQETGGVIINISSISRYGNKLQSAYSASKAGLAALTVVWAQELARHDIRVVTIAPGYLDTPLTRNIPKQYLDRIIADQIPMKRLGKVAEVAHAIEFSIENNYLSGRTIELDGGLRF